MLQGNLEINPSVTVHKLLEAYPELEDVLIGIAPLFKKLKNPILRTTVVKVATIKHIASVGGVLLDKLMTQLREAFGQSENIESYDDQDFFSEQSDWFAPHKVVLTVDEDKVEDKDKMTLLVIHNPSSALGG